LRYRLESFATPDKESFAAFGHQDSSTISLADECSSPGMESNVSGQFVNNFELTQSLEVILPDKVPFFIAFATDQIWTGVALLNAFSVRTCSIRQIVDATFTIFGGCAYSRNGHIEPKRGASLL
jgi:hypothetical protein